MNKRLHFALALVLLITSVSAHVSYVLKKSEFEANSGIDNNFLLSALSPFNLLLIAITLLVTVGIYFFARKYSLVKKEVKYIKKEASDYENFVPWIARIGVGIALVGAGTTNALISPTLSATQFLSTLQILLGFLIMIGLITSLATWAAVALFIIGLTSNFYLVGNLDFLALCLIILVWNQSKPGIDDLIGIKFLLPLKKFRKHAPTLASLGVGLVMVFLAIYEKFLNPHASRLVVENYGLSQAIPVTPAMWVFSAGVIELLVGLLLVLRIKPRLISTIAFAVLSASFFYFNEAVYSHVTLFAILSLVFIFGNKKIKNKK